MSKKHHISTKVFTSGQIRALQERIDANGGLDEVAKWYATTLLVRTKYPNEGDARNYARSTIRSLLKPNTNHDSVGRSQLALIMRDVGTPQSEIDHLVITDTVEVETKAPNASLVRVVDGIPFSLPTLDRDGAESARVTLTDLASALGYERKSKLKELAERHQKELTEFGDVPTVGLSVKCGLFDKVVNETAYNPDQAAYLALSSETPQGRACRVRILKAYKVLLAMFERTATQPQTIDINAMAGAIGAAVVGAMGPLLERLLGPKAQNDPAPQATDSRRSKAVQVETKQTRLRFSKPRRDKLRDMVATCVRPGLSGDEYSRALSENWRSLYEEMTRRGVSVLREVNRHNLEANDDLSALEWIVQNGHLDLAIECALSIWPAQAVT